MGPDMIMDELLRQWPIFGAVATAAWAFLAAIAVTIYFAR